MPEESEFKPSIFTPVAVSIARCNIEGCWRHFKVPGYSRPAHSVNGHSFLSGWEAIAYGGSHTRYIVNLSEQCGGQRFFTLADYQGLSRSATQRNAAIIFIPGGSNQDFSWSDIVISAALEVDGQWYKNVEVLDKLRIQYH